MSKISSWINKENTRVTEEFKKELDKEGKKLYYVFPVGETKIKIDVNVEPRISENGKSVLRGIVNGQAWDIPFSNVMYRRVINLLVKNIFEFSIIRVGTGKNDTKYDIKY